MKTARKVVAVSAVSATVRVLAAFDWSGFNGTVLEVPEGETVIATEAQVAKVNALTDLAIPATSEFRISDTSSGVTLGAAVTGGGLLSFKDASSVNLSGDNFGFTGAFRSTNTYLIVSGARALGKGNTFTHYTGEATEASGWSGAVKGCLSLQAEAYFTNEFHFIEGDAGGWGVSATKKAYLYGSIEITGGVKFLDSANYLYICDNVTHTGGNAPVFGNKVYLSLRKKTLDLGDADLMFYSGSVTLNGMTVKCGRTLSTGANVTWEYSTEAVLPADLSLQFGTSAGASDKRYTGGFTKGSFTFSNAVYGAWIDASNVTMMNNTIKGGGTFTFTGCGPDFGWYCNLENAGITFNSQTEPAGTLLLTYPDNITARPLKVTRGRLAIGENAQFTNVTDISVSGEGILDVRNSKAFDGEKAVLTVAGNASGTVHVPNGVTVSLKQVNLGTVAVPASVYTAETAPFRMTGGGKIVVAGGNSTTYTRNWTNASGDGDTGNAANWNSMPRFDGTEDFYFNNDGDGGTVTLTRDIFARSLIFSRATPCLIKGATGTERIILNGTGSNPVIDVLRVSGLAESAVVTNTIDVPVVFTEGMDKGWYLSQGTFLRFLKPISGGSPDARVLIRANVANYDGGGISFEAESPGWLSQLAFTNIVNILAPAADALGATSSGRAPEIHLGTHVARGLLELGGHDMTLSALDTGAAGNLAITPSTSSDKAVRVHSASPATVTLVPSGVNRHAAVVFTNNVSLTVDGAADSVYTLVRGYSNTKGGLCVRGGRLNFMWGAGWGGSVVSIDGGVVGISTNSGAVAFGHAHDADVAISNGGKLDILEGETVVVGTCTVDGVPLKNGRWFGRESAVGKANRKVEWIEGKGVLRVTRGDPNDIGFTITFR